jgi:flagellar biosynthesis/type III secretory pathway chaperone
VTLAQSSGSLITAFMEEIGLWREFAASLDREQTALRDNRIDDLQQIVVEKHDLTRRLHECGSRRMALFREAGIDAGSASLYSPFPGRFSADWDRIQSLWRQLTEYMARCRRQNQDNGVLLNLRADVVKRTLASLTGQAPEPELYGHDNRPRQSAAGNLLDRA